VSPSPFDLDAYHAWRREHPTRPLPRDAEEALVAEVTRLRVVGVLHDRSVAAGEHRERAAVVSFLRHHAEERSNNHYVEVTQEAADMIERGEHWKETT
jgi:hypothetical protein